MSEERDDETGYELRMPFVVCASQGGPYDDDSFVAGWRCGAFAEHLSAGNLELGVQPWPFPASVLPQLDLIAMSEGYTLTSEPVDDYWWQVALEHPAPKEGP